MSSTVNGAITNPDTKHGSNEALGQGQPARSVQHKNYKGFVAGVFSGVAKLTGKLHVLGGNFGLNCTDRLPQSATPSIP